MKPKHYIYKGTKTQYLIYPDGRIYDESKGIFLKVYMSNSGYPGVSMSLGPNVFKMHSIHRLVAETFIPNPENKPTVNHIDGNKLNNDISNLEWATYSENNKHAFDNGLTHSLSGDNCHFAVNTEKEIRKACELMSTTYMSLNEIEKLTGIAAKTLGEIRSGHIWQSVAKDYKFKAKPKARIKGLDQSIVNQIIQLIDNGLNEKEILKEINLSKKYKKPIYDIIYRSKNKVRIKNNHHKYYISIDAAKRKKTHKKKYRKYYKKSKAQRLSKIEKDLAESIPDGIEEYLVFSYESNQEVE